MNEGNILMKMTLEKNRLIKEVISEFLGHEPTIEEKKQFNIMNSLGESKIYHKGNFVGKINYETDDGFVM